MIAHNYSVIIYILSVNKAREESAQARKWRAFSMTWSWFFYIAYAAALIPCFICNLAINKTLSWFWIVLSALILAFTFTNLPTLIKKHKLIWVPLSMYAALVLLLGVCCIYTGGNWFFIPTIAVLLAFVAVFGPIYISKYECFAKIRKYNDFVSVAIDFVVLNLMLIVIEAFSVSNGAEIWYFKLALPIAFVVYAVVTILMCVRFLKLNKLLKSSIILFMVDVFVYLIPSFIKVNNAFIQKEIIDEANIFKANLSSWQVDVTLEQNIHLIIAITLFVTAFILFVFGMISHIKQKKIKK